MGPLMTVVSETLTAQNAKHQVFEAEGRITMPFRGESGPWVCLIGVDEAQRMVVVYSQSPVRCPAELLPEMFAFLHHANLGFTRGAFEIDADTGDIRLRVSLDGRFAPLTPRMVVEAVGFNVGLFDVGLRGVLAIIRDGATAAQAIALIESA